jgi:hypothetical protein
MCPPLRSSYPALELPDRLRLFVWLVRGRADDKQIPKGDPPVSLDIKLAVEGQRAARLSEHIGEVAELPPDTII